MKNIVKYGVRHFKKGIAQEVETVYPQIKSKQTDFIPNVYQAATKVEKLAAGYKLTFAKKHTISSTAKKLRVLLSNGEGMQEADIVSVPSTREILVTMPFIKDNKIFVYGEEVDDFRTVDYEGLTTLNISATQELSKQLRQQQAALSKQAKQIAELLQVVNELKRRKQPGIVRN